MSSPRSSQSSTRGKSATPAKSPGPTSPMDVSDMSELAAPLPSSPAISLPDPPSVRVSQLYSFSTPTHTNNYEKPELYFFKIV